MTQLTEARRLLDRRVVVPVVVGLLLLFGYQVWAWRSHAKAVKTADVAANIAKARTASTCPQVEFLYATIVRLMEGDETIPASDVTRMRHQGSARVAACRAAS